MGASRNRGELEADIMAILWASDVALTAKEIQARFQANIPAITTLITVLDRMRTKGSVIREASGGRSFTFLPTRSKLDDVAALMASALSSTEDRSAALLHFAGSLSESDRAFLRQAIEDSPAE